MSISETLAETVIRQATERRVTLATAESLTAGMIAATLADVPGASKTLLGGVVSYDPRIKHELLGVSKETIDTVGVVSDACARQMAAGARRALKADIAVSATGIAGPAGGTPETPVGTVFIGCATAKKTVATECHFTGDRRAVREQSVNRALEMILQALQA